MKFEFVFIPFRYMGLGTELGAYFDSKQVLFSIFLTAHIGIMRDKKSKL